MYDTRWTPIARLKRRLGVEAAALSESDTARMESALRAAQAEIEAATGRRFVPIYKALSHWAIAGQTALPLRDDLLQLDSVQDATGSLWLPSGLSWDSANIVLHVPDAFAAGEVIVAGLWAHHPAPGHAFRDSTDTLAAPLTADATAAVVNDAAGPDAWGDVPRFAAGSLLRVGAELLRVLAVDGDTLTVRRGENGTAAAAHDSGTPVELYIPGFVAESLGLRLAAWLYREPDAEHGREWPRGIDRAIEKLRRVRI